MSLIAEIDQYVADFGALVVLQDSSLSIFDLAADAKKWMKRALKTKSRNFKKNKRKARRALKKLLQQLE